MCEKGSWALLLEAEEASVQIGQLCLCTVVYCDFFFANHVHISMII